MALVGYARVSTRDQHPDAQQDALPAAGCTKVFTDQASGTLARRPALDDALAYLRAGDTLVVTKLDLLGRPCGTSSRSPTTSRPERWGSAPYLRASTRRPLAAG
jgi:DNA invertase Pin-like site-specific DNA recombinase